MDSKSCVKCGSPAGNQEHIFQVPYGDPLMLLFGLLSYRLTRNVHEVPAYFCDRCWQRYSLSHWVGPGIVVVFVLAIGIGLYFSAVYKTDDPISYLFIGAIVIAIAALVTRRFIRPHVIHVTNDVVKIDVPGQGIHTITMSNATGLVGLGLLGKGRDGDQPKGPNNL